MDALSVQQAARVALSCECPRIAPEFSNIPVRATVVNGAEVSLVSSGPNAVYIAYHWLNPDGTACAGR